MEQKRRGYTEGRKVILKNVTILEAADDSELFSPKGKKWFHEIIHTKRIKFPTKNGLYNVKLMVKLETQQTQQKNKCQLKSSK